MPNSSRAEGQLRTYRRYSSMVRQAMNGEQRALYQRLAREALRLAARLDPVAHASALALAKVK
jgi:hypothetical protein